MSYTINRYDGSTLTVVEDGTLDKNTDISLVGRNYAGYGEVQNENFVFLLENFANINPPPRPISGQVWFDTSASKLKFYDGEKFKTTGGAEVSDSFPNGLTEGDFWWDTTNEQLYAYNGTDFILVGPQDAGEGITQMQSRVLVDTAGVSHSVIASILNDVVIHVISNEEFEIQNTPGNAIPGFDSVKKGLTLVNTNADGQTSSDHVYWGTASNANRLGGIEADQFVRTTDAGFENLVSFSDVGLAVGDSNDLKIFIENDNEGVVTNDVGNVIKLNVKTPQGSVKNTVQFTGESLIPGKTSTGIKESVSIGNVNDTFENVYADNFFGISEQANSLLVAGTKKFGDIQASANSVAVRDSSGDLRVNLLRGTALAARYADLAEVYSSDKEYDPGTVVAICPHETHDIEIASEKDLPIGVISTNPAYIMNAEAAGQPVALKGRTPVKVVGPVQKGETLRVTGLGVAAANGKGNIIGIALETDQSTSERLIECFIKI